MSGIACSRLKRQRCWYSPPAVAGGILSCTGKMARERSVSGMSGVSSVSEVEKMPGIFEEDDEPSYDQVSIQGMEDKIRAQRVKIEVMTVKVKQEEWRLQSMISVLEEKRYKRLLEASKGTGAGSSGDGARGSNKIQRVKEEPVEDEDKGKGKGTGSGAAPPPPPQSREPGYQESDGVWFFDGPGVLNVVSPMSHGVLRRDPNGPNRGYTHPLISGIGLQLESGAHAAIARELCENVVERATFGGVQSRYDGLLAADQAEANPTVFISGLPWKTPEGMMFGDIFTFGGVLKYGHRGIVGFRPIYKDHHGISAFTGQAYICWSNRYLARACVAMLNDLDIGRGLRVSAVISDRGILRVFGSHNDRVVGNSRTNGYCWDFPNQVELRGTWYSILDGGIEAMRQRGYPQIVRG